MKLTRRLTLKGLAATCLVMTGVQCVEAYSLLPIMSGSRLDARFLSGIRQAAMLHQWRLLTPIQLNGFDSADFLRVRDILQTQTSAVLVGLTDEASATLILDLVRTSHGQLRFETPERAPIHGAAAQLRPLLDQLLTPAPPRRKSLTLNNRGRTELAFCCTL